MAMLRHRPSWGVSLRLHGLTRCSGCNNRFGLLQHFIEVSALPAVELRDTVGLLEKIAAFRSRYWAKALSITQVLSRSSVDPHLDCQVAFCYLCSHTGDEYGSVRETR